MRAAYIHGVRDLRVGDKAAPETAANEVLLNVSAVGVCGSDLHYYKEGGIGSAIISQPLVPGHQFAGRVIEDRPDLGLLAGQLVAVDPAKPCGHCGWSGGAGQPVPECRVHGSAAEDPWRDDGVISAAPSQIFPVPDNFTDIQAVMLGRWVSRSTRWTLPR